jgi:hypothetical protein
MSVEAGGRNGHFFACVRTHALLAGSETGLFAAFADLSRRTVLGRFRSPEKWPNGYLDGGDKSGCSVSFFPQQK